MSRFSDWLRMEKEPRRLVFSATPLICLLLIPLLYTLFFRSNFVSFDKWKQQLEDQEQMNFLLRRLVRGEDRTQLESTGLACHSDIHSDVCVANRAVRIDTRTMKVYAPFNEGMSRAEQIIVQPYARKEDETAMNLVSAVQILHGNITPPPCDCTHNVPAIVFSTGGFAGNLFHEFNEVIIPLFITCRHFQSRLRFVVTNFSPRMVSKYSRILSHLSSYEVINPAVNGGVHCFPGAVVGLHYHDHLALNTTGIPGGSSMADFKQFLGESYNLNIPNFSPEMERPILILVSRRKSRMILNEDEMFTMMEELGFRVVVTKPNRMSNLGKFGKVLSSCRVLVGAHGAGLTNALFLPPGAVLVQVVPLGLDWASTHYFGGPATQMGLQYLEYKIEPEESSLLRRFGRDHPVIADPASIFLKGGYKAAREVYIDGQNMIIDLVRFRETLVEARRLLGRSSPLD